MPRGPVSNRTLDIRKTHTLFERKPYTVQLLRFTDMTIDFHFYCICYYCLLVGASENLTDLVREIKVLMR